MKFFIQLKRHKQPPFQMPRIFLSLLEALAFVDGLNTAAEVFGVDAAFSVVDEGGHEIVKGENL